MKCNNQINHNININYISYLRINEEKQTNSKYGVKEIEKFSSKLKNNCDPILNLPSSNQQVALEKIKWSDG